MTYWRDKKVLITGGSSGLGRILADMFASEGCDVAIVGLEESEVRRAAGELHLQYGVKTLPLRVDITNQNDVSFMVQETVRSFGKLDVLVNNAGRSMRGSLIHTTPEQFRAFFELNVLGTIRCTQTALPHLLATRGHVVNIGSLASKAASRWTGAYPVSKHAVAAFTQQLRLEMKSEGLHVLLVCPGPIQRNDPRLYPLDGTDSVPERALAPGAGVKVGKIDPNWLCSQILSCCEKRRPELIAPWRARLLFAMAQIFPTLGDWMILKYT